MRKPLLIAVQSMSQLHIAERTEVYQPLEEEIGRWFDEHHAPKIESQFLEPMKEIVEECIARFRMIGSSSLRRHTLSTACLPQMPDLEEVSYAVTRELDLNLSSFMDDMSSAMDGTPMALADNSGDYEERIYDVVDHIFETGSEHLKASIKERMADWHALLKEVHSDLNWTAKNLGIIAYLADHDNVVFAGHEVEDAVIVYGVVDLPEAADTCEHLDENEFKDFKDEYFASPCWTDQYIYTVNGKSAHPDITEHRAGDVVRIYEVEECKS